MERDVEKLIGDKVKAADQKPVAWQKAEVWSKINANTATTRRSYFWYYAAACFLVAMGVGMYSLQMRYENALQTKISALSAAINKVTEKTASPQPVTTQTNCENDNACFKRIAKISTPTRQQHVDATMLPGTVGLQQETPALVEENTPALTEVASTETNVAKPYRVQPIIGVIIPEEKDITIAKQKKVKFRFLKSPEKEYANGGDDSKILFARIN